MKIMHLMGGGDVGGAKTHIMSLVGALSRRHEVRLISFREGDFARQAGERGIDVRVIAGNRLGRSLRRLLEEIDEMQPEVIHCHGGRANLMGALARLRRDIPVVSTIHSDYRLDYLGNPVKQWTLGTANALALRRLDYYQPVADRMAQLLIRRGFSPQRLFPIYNGMEMDSAVPADFDRAAYCREKWGVEVAPEDVLCGIAARLTAVKDVETAIRGFAAAVRQNPHLRLFIAGEGEEKEKLQRLAGELGVAQRVVFCGWVSPIDRFFAAMDINLLTSLSETFPYSILEGVREGCLTICTDVGGMNELIDPEENGFLFQPGDVDALSRALVRAAGDEKLREKLSRRLYEKVCENFTLTKTVQRQEENYQRILRLFEKEKQGGRRGVVICGAYGRGNAGDDAILQAIVQQLESIDRDMPITVLSRRPEETRLVYRKEAVYTFHFPAFCRAFRRAKLYVNGGGSLIQDVTSTRSLRFYLYTLKAAKKRGCRVMMYGCGIGPVNNPANRKRAGRVLERYVDGITLRDENSREELRRMGVTRPEIVLSADPTLILPGASEWAVERQMRLLGIDPGREYLGLGLRPWRGLDSAVDEIAAAAEYAHRQYGLIPLFIPVEYPKDLTAARKVAARLHCPYALVDERLSIAMTIGLLSRMRVVMAMRLHALRFSAGHGVPAVGLSYDPKVDGFLKYIGSSTCVPLAGVERGQLQQMLESCLSGGMQPEIDRMTRLLRDKQQEDVRMAARLLGEEEQA